MEVEEIGVLMDIIFDNESINVEFFNSFSLIYIYCCDFSYTFTFIILSLFFLKFRGIFVYFSFWNFLFERRMTILFLSRELFMKLDGWKFFVVVDV